MEISERLGDFDESLCVSARLDSRNGLKGRNKRNMGKTTLGRFGAYPITSEALLREAKSHIFVALIFAPQKLYQPKEDFDLRIRSMKEAQRRAPLEVKVARRRVGQQVITFIKENVDSLKSGEKIFDFPRNESILPLDSPSIFFLV